MASKGLWLLNRKVYGVNSTENTEPKWRVYLHVWIHGPLGPRLIETPLKRSDSWPQNLSVDSWSYFKLTWWSISHFSLMKRNHFESASNVFMSQNDTNFTPLFAAQVFSFFTNNSKNEIHYRVRLNFNRIITNLIVKPAVKVLKQLSLNVLWFDKVSQVINLWKPMFWSKTSKLDIFRFNRNVIMARL